MDKPDDRRDDPRKEANGMTIILPHDLEPFESTNPMLDVHPHPGPLPILFALRLGQVPAARFAMRRLYAVRAQIAQIGLLGGLRKVCLDLTGLVNRLVRSRAPMTRIDLQDFAGDVRHDLRLEGVAFLLARIEALLPFWLGGPRNGRLEAVNQDAVGLFDCQRRAFAAEAVLGHETVGREQLAQQRHEFVKEVFAEVRADPEEVPNHFVRHVMAQVDEHEQDFLGRSQLAFRSASHGTLAVSSCPLGLLPALRQLGQDRG